MAAVQYPNTIKITCEDESWELNREVICKESKMIAALLQTRMQEAATGVIPHTEFDAAVVERMVSWVKKKNYVVAAERDLWKLTEDRNVFERDLNEPLPNINSALMAHVAVYGIADFYDMENLRQYARKRFNAAAQYGWQLDGFVDVVKEVYRISIRQSESADLRYELCNYAMKHANQMSKLNNELSTDSQLQEFAAAMFRRSLWVKEAAND